MAVLLAAAAMALHLAQADRIEAALQLAHSDTVLLMQRRAARADDMRAYPSSFSYDEVQLHPSSFLPFAETSHPSPAVAVAVVAAHTGRRIGRSLAASLYRLTVVGSSCAQVAREGKSLEQRTHSKLDIPALVGIHWVKEQLVGGKQTSQTPFVSTLVSRLKNYRL
jgi:hypothetical protein